MELKKKETKKKVIKYGLNKNLILHVYKTKKEVLDILQRTDYLL